MNKGAQHWRNSQRRKEIERIDRKKAADDSCQKWEENDEREAEGMPVLRWNMHQDSASRKSTRCSCGSTLITVSAGTWRRARNE